MYESFITQNATHEQNQESIVTDINTTTIYAVGVPIIAALILFELLFSAYRKLDLYKLHDSAGTFGLLVGNAMVSLLSQGAIIAFYFWLYDFRLLTINDLVPAWLAWVMAFFAIDLVFYWYHRASHRVRFLWAVHMNHHSSIEMNFSVAFRQAWFGPISKVPFFLVLPLIGFDPSITAVAGVCATLWGVLGHTQSVGKLGWLDSVFNTPSTHRVHHGTNPQYLDKNYGNLFIFWDRLFGTYAKEKAPVVFGLIKNVETNNPITITFYTWREIWQDVTRSSSAREILLLLVGPPDKRLP